MAIKRLAIILFFLLQAVPALADEPLKTIPPGDDLIIILKKNEPAPFYGQLYSPETALRWANWLGQYKLRLEIDVEREKNYCGVKLNFKDELLSIEMERNTKVEEDLTQRVFRSEEARIKAEDRPFYNTVGFGIVLGAVGTVAIGVGVALLLNVFPNDG